MLHQLVALLKPVMTDLRSDSNADVVDDDNDNVAFDDDDGGDSDNDAAAAAAVLLLMTLRCETCTWCATDCA